MEQATNLFTKGLLLDTHPMVLSNDTLTDCLNGTLITMNGNEVILQNDMGNRRVDKAFLPPGYEPVGMKEYGGVIYVASYNPITNKSLIGSFPSPQKKLSSNTTEETPIFDFENFIKPFNKERDSTLEIDVLKSDSFMLPLTNNLTLRAGDKFAVYSEGLSELSLYLTNYNNVDYRFPNKAFSPKNRKYTLQLGVLNSLNEFVDITKTLCRWKNVGTVNNPKWEPINYTSDVSESYKFNDGYFISNAFTNAFDENTIENAKLIKERLKIAANTYAYKLVGPLYLKVIFNHIENFNYNIYGIYNGSSATLWVEGYLTYNCPDGADTVITNSNENYGTFDEGTPHTNFGFDLIGQAPADIQIEQSVYNPSNNTYTVKIVKKYNNITGDNNNIFNYVLGVKADKDTSNVYLRGLSVKGSIDLSLLGSGTLKFNGWRFYNNLEQRTSLLTFAFNAYPEYGKSFVNLRFRFVNLIGNNEYYYPKLNLEGLPVYNGKLTLSFGWSEIGLEPRQTYMVLATYLILNNKTGEIESTTTVSNEGISRWFLTTELFNEFFTGKDNVQDYCNNSSNDFSNKMIIRLESEASIKNQSRENQEMVGSLIATKLTNISYSCEHTYDINILTEPIVKIKNEDLYPSYIKLHQEGERTAKISSVIISSIGDDNNPLSSGTFDGFLDYSNSLRKYLFPVLGIDLNTSQDNNPKLKLLESKLLGTSINFTENSIDGKIKYYDVFKAKGDTINTITNAFDKFSKILDDRHVLPTSGYYGGVIVNFDDITGELDGHFLDVAINLDSDIGDLPGDDYLKPNWHRVHEVNSDITESGKYGDSDWVISDYLGSIYLWFNESVKDTDKTFLYYFCEGNKFNPSRYSRYGYSGKNGAAYTRAWWKMPNGEWACFYSLYKKSSDPNSFANFIKSQLGNKDLIYCMYDEYSENDFIFAPKENYIYYERYNIPITCRINYKFKAKNLNSDYTPSDIIDGCTVGYRYGNLQFRASDSAEFSYNDVEIILKSSEKFYDDINSVNSENISNVFIDRDSSIVGERYDSMGRPLNPSYVYHLENGKLERIDRTDFYIDSANKTRVGGANRLLYNTNRKSSVEDVCQVVDGNDEDSYTRLTYNSLNVVVPV